MYQFIKDRFIFHEPIDQFLNIIEGVDIIYFFHIVSYLFLATRDGLLAQPATPRGWTQAIFAPSTVGAWRAIY